MAIFTPGSIVGQISGRVAGSVYSHNAGGTYIRNGTIPTTSTSTDALAAKSRLTTISQYWQTISDANRASWQNFAANVPVTNRLGKSIFLNGHQMFVRLSTRILAAGGAVVETAPINAPPDGLTSLTLAADTGAGNVDLTFAATPLAATHKLRIRAALVQSAAINYVANKLRVIGHSAAAQASPFDIESLVTAKFGTLDVGEILHVTVDVVDTATGLVSSRISDLAAVVST